MARVSRTKRPTSILPVIDRQIARALSAELAEKNRVAFAQAFAFEVVRSCRSQSALPSDMGGTPEISYKLSRGAQKAAEELGAALSAAPPRMVAYLAGVIYTTALPDAFRAQHGIFYTPPALVDRLIEMVEDQGVDWSKARVLDPACGGGAFLLPIASIMARKLEGADPHIALKQIGVRLRGFDSDPFGAWLAQSSIELALQDLIKETRTAAPTFVQVKDSLLLSPEDGQAFDVVIGNPPYGRVRLDVDQRFAFRRSVYGHANLYGLFTDGALRWVKDGGAIGYVTPTSMLSGLYYKALRTLLRAEAPPRSIEFVNERDGVFADVLQETVLAAYKRGASSKTGKVGFVTIRGDSEAKAVKAGTFRLPMTNEAPWLLPRALEQVTLIRRMQEMPHRLADYGYGVSTGPLVWNRFKDQFRQQSGQGCRPVVWAESVTSCGKFLWRSERRNHAPYFDLKQPKDDWLIVTEPCVLIQRTTAKEQDRRIIAAEMPAAFLKKHKGVIVENHLNMARAVVARPLISAKTLAALLSSAIVDAAFRCMNGSVAVSAYELEHLPLPPPPIILELEKLVKAKSPVSRLEAVIASAYAGAHASAVD